MTVVIYGIADERIEFGDAVTISIDDKTGTAHVKKAEGGQ